MASSVTLPAEVLNTVDDRVKALKEPVTAVGTVVEVTSAMRAMVAFDGSALAVRVKVFGGGLLTAGDRVGLARFGVDWAVVGVFLPVSGPRGLKARVDSASDSAAIGAEAVVLTLPTMTFVDGRCYEWKFWGKVNTSVGNVTTFRVRQTGLTGFVKAQNLNFLSTAASQGLVVQASGYIRRTYGNDLVDNLVLTMQASTGTSTMLGASDAVRYFEVRDCGAVSDYTNAITI